MRNLILPIAGKSSRFQDMRPKWMLTNPNGNLMFFESLHGLDMDFFDNIYVTMLKEHEDFYQISENIKSVLSEKYNKKVIITLLDKETKSQPETVFETISRNEIEGFIAIKDCDNYFEISPKLENSIGVFDLHNLTSVNPSNKSYILLDVNNNITNIAEKRIISNFFCCGYYSFKKSTDFIKYYNEIKDRDSIYISHIIMMMILDSERFISIKCENYIDWGTKEDWLNYKNQFKTIFSDIDGVLFINGSENFRPKWGETEPIVENIEHLNYLFNTGKYQIILTTSRPESYRKMTEEQLLKHGVKFHKILFGLLSSQRIIVNDYSKTNPYPSCISINVQRDSKSLRDLL